MKSRYEVENHRLTDFIDYQPFCQNGSNHSGSNINLNVDNIGKDNYQSGSNPSIHFTIPDCGDSPDLNNGKKFGNQLVVANEFERFRVNRSKSNELVVQEIPEFKKKSSSSAFLTANYSLLRSP
jgi:hypothetical protein